jgi:hypothetical protein
MKHLSRAWAAPVTLLGLALALGLSVIARTRWQMVAGVIEVAPRHGSPSIGARFLRAHEHAHVRQYERWGLFLLIAYPVASACMLALGRRPYLDNPFEVQAREAETRR